MDWQRHAYGTWRESYNRWLAGAAGHRCVRAGCNLTYRRHSESRTLMTLFPTSA